MNISFFNELLSSISDRGRALLDLSIGASRETIEELSQALLTSRGEASGVALGRQILDKYRQLEDDAKLAFFKFLAVNFVPESKSVSEAASRYLFDPGEESLRTLVRAVESPKQEYFRRLNLAPGATANIVALRADLLRLVGENRDLKPLDRDIEHLLSSWFNRGFLVMRLIDWNTPAAILEKIIAYEAVHEIKGWRDLRRRLEPRDRRCFGFFHPSLVDEPLIFVEVALTDSVPGSIQSLLQKQGEGETPLIRADRDPKTAVFYSISNCQPGLTGISFGNFLIKQVVSDLSREIPSLKTFVTLSPMTGFARWLIKYLETATDNISEQQREKLTFLVSGDRKAYDDDQDLADIVLPLAVEYLVDAKNASGQPLDPVARFHLGNGARLERVNWRGDLSKKGIKQSFGVMVNYLYELSEIEKNHESYVNEGFVAISKSVRQLSKQSLAGAGNQFGKLRQSNLSHSK